MDYILIYIKGNDEGKISVYSDADYGDCFNSRKLTGGYIIFKKKNMIVWYLKL